MKQRKAIQSEAKLYQTNGVSKQTIVVTLLVNQTSVFASVSFSLSHRKCVSIEHTTTIVVVASPHNRKQKHTQKIIDDKKIINLN